MTISSPTDKTLTNGVYALVLKMGPIGKHDVAVSAKPIGVRYAAIDDIDGGQQPLAITRRKLPYCGTNSYPAVQAVGLAVPVQGAGPVGQHFVVRELKI